MEDDDHSHTLFKGIVDFRKSDGVLPSSRGWITLPSKIRKRVVTTKGWDLLAEWIDGTTSWIPLKYLKESNPIEVTEFAMSRFIQDKPAFAWWVTHFLRKRAIIINDKITYYQERHEVRNFNSIYHRRSPCP